MTPPPKLHLTTDEAAALSDGPATVYRPIDLATLQICLPSRVASEWLLFAIGQGVAAPPGTYPATMNRLGAVCAVLPNGAELGVRPGEFNFICPWIENGETVCVDQQNGGDGLRPWLIVPRAETATVTLLEPWNRDGGVLSYLADGDWIADFHEADPTGYARLGRLAPTRQPAETMAVEDSRGSRALLTVAIERTADGWRWALKLAGPAEEGSTGS